MVQDSRRIDGLEAEVLVVKMAYKERFGGKSVWLDVNICSCDASQEARFSDVGITADEESTCVWVYSWKTAEMLPDLLQVDERIFEPATDRSHSPKGGALELLALEEGLGVF